MKFEEGRYCCEVTGQGFGETKVAKLPQVYVSLSPLLRILPGVKGSRLQTRRGEATPVC